MPALYVPENYGYVALAVTSYLWLNQYQLHVVAGKRKVAKIAYPQAYAEKREMESNKDAKVFNCAQRAHQNTLEFAPWIVFGTLFMGLLYPLTAAISGAAYTLGRILYTVGYVNYGNRYKFGPVSTAASLVLLLGTTWASIEMALGKW